MNAKSLERATYQLSFSNERTLLIQRSVCTNCMVLNCMTGLMTFPLLWGSDQVNKRSGLLREQLPQARMIRKLSTFRGVPEFSLPCPQE